MVLSFLIFFSTSKKGNAVEASYVKVILGYVLLAFLKNCTNEVIYFIAINAQKQNKLWKQVEILDIDLVIKQTLSERRNAYLCHCIQMQWQKCKRALRMLSLNFVSSTDSAVFHFCY